MRVAPPTNHWDGNWPPSGDWMLLRWDQYRGGWQIVETGVAEKYARDQAWLDERQRKREKSLDKTIAVPMTKRAEYLPE